jgi:hypothetical protein
MGRSLRIILTGFFCLAIIKGVGWLAGNEALGTAVICSASLGLVLQIAPRRKR